MSYLIIRIILFFGTHSVSIINAPWRNKVVNKIGLLPWQGFYSLVSIVGFVLIIQGYDQASQSFSIIYQSPPWLHYVAFILMIPVFPLLVATYSPGRINAITKHPMLAATKIWALAHLLVNGGLADVILFGSFLAWAIIDRISVKRRAPLPVAGLPSSRFNDAIAIVLGLSIYVAFIYGIHDWLFGVPLKL